MNLQEHIRRILREEITYVKDVRIKISDILPINSDGQSLKDAIINVKDGLSSHSQELPLLLKMGNKYEILDGFHRIAQKILNGDRYIVADVFIKEPKITLQESIRRILREDHSPAGKEITPNDIVVHKSNPIFRDNIMSEGLKVKAGECYKIYVGYGTKCKPAIFATNSTNKRAWFDSTYDDDIWFIDTTKIPNVKWYKDKHFESTKKHIVTFQDIPSEALTLHYEGTGKSEDLLEEHIRRILREEIDDFSWIRETNPFNLVDKNWIIHFDVPCDLEENTKLQQWIYNQGYEWGYGVEMEDMIDCDTLYYFKDEEWGGEGIFDAFSKWNNSLDEMVQYGGYHVLKWSDIRDSLK